jgi:hypothetical protein
MSILRLIRAGAFSGSLIARSGARVSALIKIPIKISGLRDEIRDFIRRRQKKKKKRKKKKRKTESNVNHRRGAMILSNR